MKKVLCFGDSNTFGFNPIDGSRYDKNIRWTGILQTFCEDNFKIIEAGCNNRTAFSDNLAGMMFTGYKILPEILNSDLDFVVLAIGINDLQFQYQVTLADIETGISKLIEIVQNKIQNAKIILVVPTRLTIDVLKSPIFSTLFDQSSIDKSKNLSKIYSKVAQKYNCKFLDLNEFVVPSKIDGLHFEPKAHEKIAKKIFELLNGELC